MAWSGETPTSGASPWRLAVAADNQLENHIWLVVSTPLKNMKVGWDDYSQYMENRIHVPNHQPDIY
jgi:hypothetical protein